MSTVIDELVTVLKFSSNTEGLDKAKKELHGFQGAIQHASTRINDLRRSMIEGFAANAVMDAMRATVHGVVDVNRRFQVLQARLETVEGSAAKAGSAFRMLRQLAQSTPFEVENLTDAYTRLKAQGIEPTTRDLIAFGDTASGMGKDIVDYSEAVLDAVNGEFERMKEFGIKMGKEGDQVSIRFKGMTMAVRNDAASIKEALVQLGEAHFAGSMERISKTLHGAFSNLTDAAAEAALKMGEGGLAEAIMQVTRGLTTMITDSTTMEALGAHLGQVVLELWDVFQGLARSLADIEAKDIAEFFDALTQALHLLGGVLQIVVKHWDYLIAAFVAAKVYQGVDMMTGKLSGLTGKLEGVGQAAAGVLGPWGKLIAGFIAALPILIDVGEKLGKIMYESSRMGDEERLSDDEAGGKTTKRGPAKRFYDKSMAEKIAVANRRIHDLTNTVRENKWDENAWGPGRAGQTTAMLYAERNARAELEVVKAERDQLWAENDAKLKRLKQDQQVWGPVIQGAAGKAAGALGTAIQRNIVDPWQADARRGRYAQLLAARDADPDNFRPSQQSELSRLAKELDVNLPPVPHKKAGKKAKEADIGLFGQDREGQPDVLARMEARAQQMIDAAADRAYMAAGGSIKERKAAGIAAGEAERARIAAEVQRGNHDVLGGEFSKSQQMLRDAGLLEHGQIAPPVLTVTINRFDMKVDSPISIEVGTANATASEIADASRSAIRRVLTDEVKTAMLAIVPRQRA